MSEHELHWQDEILQVMYWMRGENLGQEVTPEQLNRFLHLEPAQLQAALQQLLVLRLIRAQADNADGSQSFALTGRGIAEGKRRFLDEFSSYLGKESHLECEEPDCDCHSPDWDGVCHTAKGR
jgi:hypothetical protein